MINYFVSVKCICFYLVFSDKLEVSYVCSNSRMILACYKIDNSLLMLAFQVIQLCDFHNNSNCIVFLILDPLYLIYYNIIFLNHLN